MLRAVEQGSGLRESGYNRSRESLDNVVAFLNGDTALAPGRRVGYQTLTPARCGDVELAVSEVDINAVHEFFQHWITELSLNER